MGTLLKAAGLLLVIGFGVRQAGQVAFSKVSWRFLPIRLKDMQLRLIGGKLSAVLVVRLEITNNLPVAISLSSYRATLTQEGQQVGAIQTTSPIQINPDRPTTIEAETLIGAESFIARLKNIVEGQGNIMAPIQIKGELSFTDGLSIPINQTWRVFAVS